MSKQDFTTSVKPYLKMEFTGVSQLSLGTTTLVFGCKNFSITRAIKANQTPKQSSIISETILLNDIGLKPLALLHLAVFSIPLHFFCILCNLPVCLNLWYACLKNGANGNYPAPALEQRRGPAILK